MRVAFFAREAFRALTRNAAPSLAAMVTVLLTALVLGVFIPVVQATTGTANEVRGRVVVDVFLKEGSTDAQRTELRRQLLATPNVRSVEFVSKQEALREELGYGKETVVRARDAAEADDDDRALRRDRHAEERVRRELGYENGSD